MTFDIYDEIYLVAGKSKSASEGMSEDSDSCNDSLAKKGWVEYDDDECVGWKRIN